MRRARENADGHGHDDPDQRDGGLESSHRPPHLEVQTSRAGCQHRRCDRRRTATTVRSTDRAPFNDASMRTWVRASSCSPRRPCQRRQCKPWTLGAAKRFAARRYAPRAESSCARASSARPSNIAAMYFPSRVTSVVPQRPAGVERPHRCGW
jgi:hypothetical protein